VKFLFLVLAAISTVFSQGDSTVQPTRVSEYQPIPGLADSCSPKRQMVASLALASTMGLLSTYGIRLDYGFRYDKSRVSLIGSIEIGYAGEARDLRLNGGAGVCISQPFFTVGRKFSFSSGCGLGFWTIRDYYSNQESSSSHSRYGPPKQNGWFLLNTRADYVIKGIPCFCNLDILLGPSRFTPCLGIGIEFH
jgi:hypothetical protein